MNANQRKYRIIENYSILCADMSCVIISYILAYAIRANKRNAIDMSVVGIVFVITLAVSMLFYLMSSRGYKFFSRGYLVELIETAKRSIILFILIGFLIYALRYEKGYSRLMLGYFSSINFVLTYVVRCITKNLTLRDFRQGKKGDQVLLISTSDKVEDVFELIKKDEHWSYKICAIALTDKDETGQSIHDIPIVASMDNMSDILQHLTFDVVFLYYPELNDEDTNSLIESIQLTGAMCHYATQLPAKSLFHVSTGKFASLPVITYSSVEYDYRMRVVKRLIDIAGSFVGLVITAIVTPFVALAIKIDSPGPIFFKQTRLSKNGRKFEIYKFRTMYIDAEERKKELMAHNEMKGNMFKMENDPRITRVGKFLRKTSIDELPQFWNIFCADMSLVGTRPPTVEEFENYTEMQKRRLSIRPGLTGMWQVSGRSKITDFDEIVKLDLEYIDNWSLALDIKILLKTVFVVFAHKGAK